MKKSAFLFLEKKLILAVVALLPLFHLTLKSWTNASLAILFFLSIIMMFKKPYILDQLRSGWETKLIFAALLAPLFGVIAAQVLRHHWFWKPMDGPFRVAMAAFVFLLLKKEKIRCTKVFRWVLPISVGICFFSILCFKSGTEHWGGRFATYFADCDVFGQHIVLITFLSFMMFQMGGYTSKPLFALEIFSLGAGVYMAMGSQTRGAWIALCPLSVLWVFFLRKQPLKIARNLIILLLFFGSLVYFNSGFKDRLFSIYTEIYGWWSGNNIDTSGGVRLSMWKITFALFMHSPICGYGEYEQFKNFLQEPFVASVASEAARATINNGPHNQLAAEVLRSGIFGLIYSAGTFLIPGWIFIRSFRKGGDAVEIPAVIGLCVVVAFGVFSLTLEVFNLKFAVSFYGFLIAALTAECLAFFHEDTHTSKSDKRAQTIVSGRD